MTEQIKATAHTARIVARSGIGATLNETAEDRAAHERRKAEQAARIARIQARQAAARQA